MNTVGSKKKQSISPHLGEKQEVGDTQQGGHKERGRLDDADVISPELPCSWGTGSSNATEQVVAGTVGWVWAHVRFPETRTHPSGTLTLLVGASHILHDFRHRFP